MESIRRHVRRAGRRLNAQCFLRIVPWTTFAALSVAVAAIAAPKIWALEVHGRAWAASWLGGAFLCGLFAAAIGAWRVRRDSLDAAMEIDRRFRWKERVSSAVALPSEERETSVGRALVADAARRLETTEVRAAFRPRLSWSALLPFAPIVAGTLLALMIPDAVRDKAQASAAAVESRRKIQRSARELTKKLAERARRAEEAGLKDAEALFRQLRAGADELVRRDDVDRQQALIQLNDLAKEVEKRRAALGGVEELRRQLERLQDLERGPADRLADALRQGDPEQALRELRRLLEELKSGSVSPEQQRQLARQLQDLRRSVRELADQHQQTKQELQRQIQQKLSEGDLEAAGKLRRKLDELSGRDQGMRRLEDLADRLGKAGDSLEQGDREQADAELSELADNLREMRTDLDQMEQLDEMLEEIAGAKSSMKCEHCNGEGCEACQGGGTPLAEGGSTRGDGLGEGQGSGERPETSTDTGSYESRLRAKPKAGEAVRTGDAPGPNRPGLSQQEVKEAIAGALREEADPISEQRLPRAQQDHVRQYYERRRKGE